MSPTRPPRRIYLGVGQGRARFLYVTFSTRIGSGAILDHKPYRGVDGSHPAVGHSIMDRRGPPCYCLARGCWELLASGTALEVWINVRRPGGPGLSAREICDLAEQGDPLPQEAVQREADYLGLGLANLVTRFVPAEKVRTASCPCWRAWAWTRPCLARRRPGCIGIGDSPQRRNFLQRARRGRPVILNPAGLA